LLEPRHHDERKPGDEGDKHSREQLRGAGWGRGEFLPDEHAPERSDHRRPLSEPVGDRKAGRARGDEAHRHADTPDYTTEDTGEMRAEITLEVGRVAHGGADEWLLHCQRAPHEVTEEHPDREHEHRRVWAELPRLRVHAVAVHRRGHEAIE